MFGSASTMDEMAGLCTLEWSHSQISPHGLSSSAIMVCEVATMAYQKLWASSRKRWAHRNPFLLSGAQSMKISDGLELLSVDSSREIQSKGLAINLDVEEHSGVWPWMTSNSNRGQWHLQSDARFLGLGWVFCILIKVLNLCSEIKFVKGCLAFYILIHHFMCVILMQQFPLGLMFPTTKSRPFWMLYPLLVTYEIV